MAMPRGRRAHPEHGTIAAYRMHLKYGPPPCDDCKQANRAKSAQRRAEMIVCPDCGQLKKMAPTYRCDWCYKLYRDAHPRRKKAPRVKPAMEVPGGGTAVSPQAPALHDPESA